MIFVKRFFTAFLAASILFTGSIQTVQAAMISAGQVAESAVSNEGNQNRALIVAALSREDVQAALVARGIDPAQAQDRVAALTDEEAGMVASQLDTAPAGGIIGAILLVFFVLLLTDILGFTKIFPFTRSVR
ncbi:PA2779 family protein [Methylotenera sp. G11]|uniref:PA2779 family protein n=1 Tax=Methylotenera sp. G11 TaxID=1506585 RepID=UPI000645722B|nr:PA2779 family protein [Methylotenera sp. G11]